MGKMGGGLLNYTAVRGKMAMMKDLRANQLPTSLPMSTTHGVQDHLQIYIGITLSLS